MNTSAMSQIRAELNAGVETDTRCKVMGNLVQVRHRYQWHALPWGFRQYLLFILVELGRQNRERKVCSEIPRS